MKYGSRSRYVILGVVLLLLMAALIYQLSNVTLAAGAEYAEQAAIKATSTIDVEGTRGRILDRNGVVLAYSKDSYNVEFLRDGDNRTDYDSAIYTEALMKAIEIIEAGGGTTIDTSYIRQDPDTGELYYDWGVSSKANQVARYRNFCEAMGFTIEYDENIKDKALWDTSEWPTAEESYKKLRALWFIPEELTFAEANKIISIRQEVNLNNYRAYEPITIFILAPGAFFVLAMLTALQNKLKMPCATNGSVKKKTKLGCSGDCLHCAGHMENQAEQEGK